MTACARWQGKGTALQSPSMRIRWLLVAFLVAACSTTALQESKPVAVPTWNDRMLELDEHCQALKKALLRQPQGNLVTAAATARQAASILHDGYGIHEDRTVPGFARFAHAAESWLIGVALEARQAHGELAAEQFQAGFARHCSACHDAVDAAKKKKP